jgi:hypothetical protein
MKHTTHITLLAFLGKQRLLLVLLFIAALGSGSLSERIDLGELCIEMTEEAEAEGESEEQIKEVFTDEFTSSNSSRLTKLLKARIAFEMQFPFYPSPTLELSSPPPELKGSLA